MTNKQIEELKKQAYKLTLAGDKLTMILPAKDVLFLCDAALNRAARNELEKQLSLFNERNGR